MERCRICARPAMGEWLDFGPQAIRNRYLRSREESEFLHALAIGVCSACGTVQLASPPPVCELRPRFGWIRYNEPEGHLDHLVTMLAQLPGAIASSSRAYKGAIRPRKLNARVHSSGGPISTHLTMRVGGIERSGRRRLFREAAARWHPRRAVVRHAREHANTLAGLGGRVLAAPKGTSFSSCRLACAPRMLDLTTVWEERPLLHPVIPGLSRTRVRGVIASYPYPLENSLVAIVKA